MANPTSRRPLIGPPRKPIKIGPYDVLCGRNKNSFDNVGNRRFRVTVSIFISQYNNASTKMEKSEVISTIVDLIKQAGGRFLMEDHQPSGETDAFVELGKKHAHRKVGHAIRDMARALEAKNAKAELSSLRRTKNDSHSTRNGKRPFPPPTSLQSASLLSLGRKRFSCQERQSEDAATFPGARHTTLTHATDQVTSISPLWSCRNEGNASDRNMKKNHLARRWSPSPFPKLESGDGEPVPLSFHNTNLDNCYPMDYSADCQHLSLREASSRRGSERVSSTSENSFYQEVLFSLLTPEVSTDVE